MEPTQVFLHSQITPETTLTLPSLTGGYSVAHSPPRTAPTTPTPRSRREESSVDLCPQTTPITQITRTALTLRYRREESSVGLCPRTAPTTPITQTAPITPTAATTPTLPSRKEEAYVALTRVTAQMSGAPQEQGEGTPTHPQRISQKILPTSPKPIKITSRPPKTAKKAGLLAGSTKNTLKVEKLLQECSENTKSQAHC